MHSLLFFDLMSYPIAMKLSHASIIGLPVRTSMGQFLGKVSDFMIEADTGRLEVLEIRAGGFLQGLIDQHILVSWGQIVSLSNREVVVQDGVIPIRAGHLAVDAVPSVTPPSAS